MYISSTFLPFLFLGWGAVGVALFFGHGGPRYNSDRAAFVDKCFSGHYGHGHG